jgi:hypothetical protein
VPGELVWRCSVRCADYGMPGGVQIRGPQSHRHGGVQTRNVIVHVDPATLRPIEVFPVHEMDGLPRNKAANRGYEDMRLFHTTAGGLQGIAAAAHLERRGMPTGAGAPGDSNPPEQVVLTFESPDAGKYDIAGATPIRGNAWFSPQKNWSPFDGAQEPRFLYSISRGIVFGLAGPIGGLRALDPEDAPPLKKPLAIRNAAHAGRPASAAEMRVAPQPQNLRPTLLPNRQRYSGLRGGTQLVYLGDVHSDGSQLGSRWLGLGHEMMLVRGRKLYWHVWYLVDSDGELTHVTPRMKLATEGIEFAAGLVVEGERVVVSFGVDDAACRFGETSLPAVLSLMQPYEAPEPDKPTPSKTGMMRRDADAAPQVRRPRLPGVGRK